MTRCLQNPCLGARSLFLNLEKWGLGFRDLGLRDKSVGSCYMGSFRRVFRIYAGFKDVAPTMENQNGTSPGK